MTLMNKETLEQSLQEIGGFPVTGWRKRAGDAAGVSERGLRDALNAGKWSKDFERKILAALAKTQSKKPASSSASAPLLVRAPQKAHDDIKMKLVQIAGGEGHGWIARVAEILGVDRNTVSNALDGKGISAATDEKIRIAYEASRTGSRYLDRQAGEWAVGAPTRMTRGVIGEAVVTHIIDPVMVLHLIHKAGKTGFGSGSEGLVEVSVKWLGEPGARAAELVKHATDLAHEHVAKQLRQREALEYRKEAERVGGARLMTVEDAEKATYAELMNSGKVIENDSVYERLNQRIHARRTELARDYATDKAYERFGGNVNEYLSAHRELGFLDAMRSFAAQAMRDPSLDTPASSMMTAAVSGKFSQSLCLKEVALNAKASDATVERDLKMEARDAFINAVGSFFLMSEDMPDDADLADIYFIIPSAGEEANADFRARMETLLEQQLNRPTPLSEESLHELFRASAKDCFGIEL